MATFSQEVKISGLKVKTVLGRSLWQYLPILEPFKDRLNRALQSGEAIALYKQKILPDDERYFDIE